MSNWCRPVGIDYPSFVPRYPLGSSIKEGIHVGRPVTILWNMKWPLEVEYVRLAKWGRSSRSEGSTLFGGNYLGGSSDRVNNPSTTVWCKWAVAISYRKTHTCSLTEKHLTNGTDNIVLMHFLKVDRQSYHQRYVLSLIYFCLVKVQHSTN